LLYGATGSGKTEVYFRAAKQALRCGRSVLYLVPEIGLTPLLLSKVSRRFPGAVAVLHSGLPKARRAEAWRRACEGRARFIVGTRSAVFAPLASIGLIVVDEEQDSSYKQEESPRYNGRDLAVLRAREEGAVLLLGSATPSMETFHHARAGRYRLLRLGGRVEDRPLPNVTLVDMRDEYRSQGVVAPLSSHLAEALRDCVERGEQALVLRNRRGWAAAVLCPTCGERIGCRRCSIAMTWHRAQQRMRCHYCGLEECFPAGCPKCAADDLQLVGEGTEKIEDLIRAAVPNARVERMDRDTVRKRGAHEDLLRRFDRGEIDILAGTQMIAKGHDFPRVTLVGVLAADQPLGLPDFRASERVFQLLTQVAGRAGRGERPGRVIVQVFNPEHPVLRQAAEQDFEAFYEREVEYRRALRYPPFVGLVQLMVHDKQEHQARAWAEILGTALREEAGEELLVAGPGPAPIERLRGSYRQQILVRSAGRLRLVAAVEGALARTETTIPRRAVAVDVDPYSLL
jgi:primosomal protein N' (replication factor Y)